METNEAKQIAVVAKDTVLEMLDEMITETVERKRSYPPPLMGGGHQAPFDGETMGTFIRFVILMEVRDRFSGEKHTEKDIMNLYRLRTYSV